MRRALLTIVCLSLFALGAAAQHTVSGKVVSDTDGSVLEMTTIRLFRYTDTDSVLVQGAQTGLDGIFTLRAVANGEYRLYVSNVLF